MKFYNEKNHRAKFYHRSIIATIFMMILFAQIASASNTSNANASNIMTLLQRNYGGERPVTAAFTLSIYWDVRERTENRNGELQIATGNRFRVTLGGDVFVSDGRTFWQYSERNSQVVIRRFTDIDPATLPTGMLATFLAGRTFAESRGDGGAITLTWNGDDGEYREIIVTVNARDGVINTLRMTDVHNNIHTYTFANTTFDRAPRGSVFQFNAPRGTSVVDMRE